MIVLSSSVVAWIVAVLGLSMALAQVLARRREADALARMVRVLERMSGGDTHLVTPELPGRLLPLAKAVNLLADKLRKNQLNEHPERVFDQALVRETPNGLMVVDGRGVIRVANRAARELLPWTAEPVGQRAVDVLPLTPLADVLREAADTREAAERAARVGSRDLLLRGIPLADGGGTLGVILDITSVVSAERVRREFVATVSHELRTPVTSIVGYAESLADEEIPPSARSLLTPLVRNALRLSRLCEDVLALSRLEARSANLPLEPLELLPLTEELIDGFQDRAAGRDITLTVEGDCGVAQVNADAYLAAVQNLVDNALKYTPTGGHVTVRLSRQDHRALVSVADDGPGIDPIHHARLFERFYRVDPGRSRDAGGTGLGLALVKHYGQAMGAEVSMTSAVGEGSTFILSFPAA